MPCKWAKKKAAAFKAGKLGNSKNAQKHFMGKKKWKRLIASAKKRYILQHPAPRLPSGWCSVCTYFVSSAKCMAYGLLPSGACANATQQADKIHHAGKVISKFVIKCGGAGLIGYAAKTDDPKAALIVGAAACSWAAASDAVKAASEPCLPRPAAMLLCRPAA